MHKKSILICGHTGILGSIIMESLIKNPLFEITGINSKSLDLTKQSKVNHFCKKKRYDVLIFLVGLAHFKGARKDLNRFMQINYKTLYNLLNGFIKFNHLPKKIIFTSTISVYGDNYLNSYYNESSEIKPQSPYAITKLKAETLLMNNHSKITWILRLCPIYSKRFKLNINRRTKLGPFFYRVGDGNKKLSLCNARNVILAINSIIADDDIPAGKYIVSDKKVYTYNHLLKWNKANKIIKVPSIIVKLFYYVGKFSKNIFLEENSIKLLTDNIYDSSKLHNYIDLSIKDR